MKIRTTKIHNHDRPNNLLFPALGSGPTAVSGVYGRSGFITTKLRRIKRLITFIVALGCWPGGAWAADNDKAKAAVYTTFWKTALAESSGISEAVLAPLIEVDKTEIRTWDSGKTFVVEYTIKMDWLTIKREDKFMVWINESESGFGYLGLPRDAWLTGPDLRKVIDNHIFDSAIGHVDPKMKPAFSSLDDAKAFVCKEHGLASLYSAKVAFYVPGKIPHVDGMPYLVWFAVLKDKANKGLYGYLNLVTKSKKSWEDAMRRSATPPGGGFDGEK